MKEYDPKILRSHADRLYAKASATVWRYVLLGIVLGALAGYTPMIAWYLRGGQEQPPGVEGFIIFMALLGAVVFGAIGANRAFKYKLQAQTVLCQVQIENNTRALSLILNLNMSVRQTRFWRYQRNLRKRENARKSEQAFDYRKSTVQPVADC